MSEYKRHILGINGEKIATEYLNKNNYKIIERNFRCRQGEIDIIAYDKKCKEYVFVEVKTRTNFEYGKPIDSVNKMKQKHIASATKYYIYLNNIENKYIRFDIIEIYKKDKYIINHIKNAEINQYHKYLNYYHKI